MLVIALAVGLATLLWATTQGPRERPVAVDTLLEASQTAAPGAETSLGQAAGERSAEDELTARPRSAEELELLAEMLVGHAELWPATLRRSMQQLSGAELVRLAQDERLWAGDEFLQLLAARLGGCAVSFSLLSKRARGEAGPATDRTRRLPSLELDSPMGRFCGEWLEALGGDLDGAHAAAQALGQRIVETLDRLYEDSGTWGLTASERRLARLDRVDLERSLELAIRHEDPRYVAAALEQVVAGHVRALPGLDLARLNALEHNPAAGQRVVAGVEAVLACRRGESCVWPAQDAPGLTLQCLGAFSCAPGTSVDMLIARHFSLAEQEIIQDLVQQLLRLRAGAG